MTNLYGPNPVLMRELRTNLRHLRTFALIAFYVVLLSCIALVDFPAGSDIDFQADGGAKGRELFSWLVWGQVGLVLLLIPALATGILAQERERQTLEPLLLTPLTPLQVVWGKAGGVLSVVGLLLLSTMPLTSLCFLLGGVANGEFIMAYGGIFGLAVFTTAFGLYCAARWPGATRSMMMCYLLLPVALALVAAFFVLGSIFAGIFALFLLGWWAVQFWNSRASSPFAKRLGAIYPSLIWILMPSCYIALFVAMWINYTIGGAVVAIFFILSYFVMTAQWAFLETGRELLRHPESTPLRQQVADFREDWTRAVAAAPEPPVYLPGHNPIDPEWAPVSEGAPVLFEPPPPVRKPARGKATYGKTPFLSDRLNPIYAREMRSGLLGKFEYLFRFGYIIVIVSQVVLLGTLIAGASYPQVLSGDEAGTFEICGLCHLAIVMVCAAWFGARAIAPEREGQTLVQLFTIPLRPIEVITGKTMAVLTFTLYVWLMAIPPALLLGLIKVIPLNMAVCFTVVEGITGVLCAAWGIYCSFHSVAVRRAVSTAIGGSLALMVLPSVVNPVLDLLRTMHVNTNLDVITLLVSIMPATLLFAPTPSQISDAQAAHYPVPIHDPLFVMGALCLYLVVSAGLLVSTARNLRRYINQL